MNYGGYPNPNSEAAEPEPNSEAAEPEPNSEATEPDGTRPNPNRKLPNLEP